MNIKTKFDIGDEVYFFENGEINKMEISEISTKTNNKTKVKYTVENNFTVQLIKEKNLFKTTKELFNHIEKEIKEADKKFSDFKCGVGNSDKKDGK